MSVQEKQIDWRCLSSLESSIQAILHHHFTSASGGLIAPTIPMNEIQKALDIGCGSGNWAIDMAKHHPGIHITGIDIDEQALHDAILQGYWSGLPGLTFLHMNATQSLAFADGAFDLVYIRCATFLHSLRRSDILTEFLRVLRPGGWLNLVDYEPGQTSSEAFNRLMSLQREALRAYHAACDLLSFRTLRPVAQLYYLLLQAELLDVSYRVHALNFCADATPGARELVEGLLAVALRWKPLITEYTALKPSGYDALVHSAHKEMLRPHFCGYAYLISAAGCKNG